MLKMREYSPLVGVELRTMWDAARITDAARFVSPVARIKSMMGAYAKVEAACGVPWWFVAVVHIREADGDFRAHLHNGDSLRARTVHVPAGRPKSGKPPFAWHESAIDALTMPGKHLDRISDWNIGRALWELERYNGLGYRLYHNTVPSPYLWAGTHFYVAGKYVADGKWSATARDKQPGCAGLLKVLAPRDLA